MSHYGLAGQRDGASRPRVLLSTGCRGKPVAVTGTTPQCELLGTRRLDGSTVHFLALSQLADWPERFGVASRHVGLFLALDGRRVAVDEIARVSGVALAAGVVTFTAAGPDCERVRQIFSQVSAARNLETGARAPILTTSGRQEPIDFACERFLRTARPDAEFRSTCRAYVIATVGMNRPDAFSQLVTSPVSLAAGE